MLLHLFILIKLWCAIFFDELYSPFLFFTASICIMLAGLDLFVVSNYIKLGKIVSR